VRLIVLLFGLLILPSAPVSAEAEQPNSDGPLEAVVLLHGLARTDGAMRPLESRLSKAGYVVHNVSYPSTELAPEDLDAYLHDQVVACCQEAPRLHYVTHSLGGILVRAYLAEHETPNLGRVVMLAPPNHGSELVDLLGDSAAFRWALGSTAAQLGTDPHSLPNRLPPPHYEVGVIAGTRSINPLGSLVVPGPSDGTVSVRSTQLEGMSDFITISVSHTFIMRSEIVTSQVLEFLRNGRFKRSSP
jgi:pimeloyl-ACP methyl ester carboxylesterase